MQSADNPGIRSLSSQLIRKELTSTQIVEQRLDRARGAEGVFTALNESVLAAAQEADRRRRDGVAGVLEGIPVTLKDLYNVQGQVTLAGSRVLQKSARKESADAAVVAHLRQAGLLFLGRTNMSEFAFSGMGLNPHYPPLLSVWDRATGRLPGGSSSGSAVSVALGIVPGTLGSDTAGSCRIPAAFNGIVGVKPSYGRLSLDGVVPLSPSSDAPGPLGVDVDTCFILDHLMAGAYDGSLPDLRDAAPDDVKLVIPAGIVMSDLDSEVAMAFERAVGLIAEAGFSIDSTPMPVVDDCVTMFLERPVVPFEAWRDHKDRLMAHGDEYDPYVKQRMSNGQHVSAEEQDSRYRHKAELIARFNRSFDAGGASALIYPTVACIPPAVSGTMDPERIGGINLRCLRNTATVNYFDGCAISLPCHRDGEAPVGLMLAMPHGHDPSLYALANSLEKILRR